MGSPSSQRVEDEPAVSGVGDNQTIFAAGDALRLVQTDSLFIGIQRTRHISIVSVPPRRRAAAAAERSSRQSGRLITVPRMFSPLIFHVALSTKFRYRRRREASACIPSHATGDSSGTARSGSCFFCLLPFHRSDGSSASNSRDTVPQRSIVDACVNSSALSEAWGAWQTVHSPSFIGSCFVIEFSWRWIVSAWHVPQSWTGGSFRSACLRRRMGIVTIEAPVFSQHGQMEAVLGEHVVDHGVVASPAQFKTLLLQGERIRRSRAFMAQIARSYWQRADGPYYRSFPPCLSRARCDTWCSGCCPRDNSRAV